MDEDTWKKGKGWDAWQSLRADLATALSDGDKYYSQHNQAAGVRARKALDRIAKTKVTWRKECMAK